MNKTQAAQDSPSEVKKKVWEKGCRGVRKNDVLQVEVAKTGERSKMVDCIR